MLFRVLDYVQVPVILSKETWFKKLLDPTFGHLEVKSLLPQIRKTIQKPDKVYQSIRDPRSKLLFTEIKSGEFKSYFLSVVIKYVREQGKKVGYVSTVMINRELPKKGKLLWERKSSI